jgi:hypothetical protein
MTGPLLFVAAKGGNGGAGVTTSVLAAAGSWVNWREPLVIEADPSGGDLMLWLAALEGDETTLCRAPSTVTLAAAGAPHLSIDDIVEHTQRLPGTGELRALIGPSSAFAASAAIAELVAAGLARELMESTRYDVLIDGGRLDAGSPVLGLARTLGSVVVVVRSTVASVDHSAELVEYLRDRLSVHSKLLVIGDDRYVDQVAQEVGADVLGVLPEDADAAAQLAGTGMVRRRLDRTRLVRAARVLAGTLASSPSTVPSASLGTSFGSQTSAGTDELGGGSR